MKKILSSKKICLITAMTIVVIGSLIIILSLLNMFYTNNNIKVTYEPRTVYSGDTIWKLAVECDLKQDIRETIYQIREKNNLESPIIYPGQELLVPIKGEEK